MQVTYQTTNYTPERVTGAYVRSQGRKGKYTFIVFETVSGPRGPGMGPTIREYITNGDELPDELRLKCIEGKFTEKWY